MKDFTLTQLFVCLFFKGRNKLPLSFPKRTNWAGVRERILPKQQKYFPLTLCRGRKDTANDVCSSKKNCWSQVRYALLQSFLVVHHLRACLKASFYYFLAINVDMKIKALSRTCKLLARLRDADATFESPLSLQYNFGLQRLSLTQQRMSYKLLQNSFYTWNVFLNKNIFSISQLQCEYRKNRINCKMLAQHHPTTGKGVFRDARWVPNYSMMSDGA